MITTSAYTEVATAPGTWTCPVTLAGASFKHVQNELTKLARIGWPVNAFAYGDADEPVTELLLYRDPSRTYGTPEATQCDATARALVTATGWTATPERAPQTGILVGLGLREGYQHDARQHQPSGVTARLAAHGNGWTCRTARLVSARLVDDVVRWYDEFGVAVHTDEQLRPVITDLARAFGQHRFTITDLTGRRTYVLQR
jgi:hypothetical protein